MFRARLFFFFLFSVVSLLNSVIWHSTLLDRRITLIFSSFAPCTQCIDVLNSIRTINKLPSLTFGYRHVHAHMRSTAQENFSSFSALQICHRADSTCHRIKTKPTTTINECEMERWRHGLMFWESAVRNSSRRRTYSDEQLSGEVMLCAREHILYISSTHFARNFQTHLYTKLMMIVFQTCVIDFHWHLLFFVFDFSPLSLCCVRAYAHPFNKSNGERKKIDE